MWLGHVASMNKNRRVKQVMNWALGGKKGRGRPRKNWVEALREDLRGLELRWENILDAAEDRDGWSKCIARCAALHGMD